MKLFRRKFMDLAAGAAAAAGFPGNRKRASLSNTAGYTGRAFPQAGRSTDLSILGGTCRLPSANPSLSRTSRVLRQPRCRSGRPCRA